MKSNLLAAVLLATQLHLLAAESRAPKPDFVVHAQERPAVSRLSRVAPRPNPPAEPVLPQFLQQEVVEFPVNPRAKARTFSTLDTMHDTYFDDFSKKPGFGASRILYLPPQDYLTLNGETYRFVAPDLLGLEDELLAYTRPRELISMAEMSKKESRAAIKHRPLSADELRAVAELRAGKSLVTIPKTFAVRTAHGTNEVAGLLAVGALRAKAHCAECHQVKEGALLGAFSYTLVPTNSIAPRVLATLGGR